MKSNKVFIASLQNPFLFFFQKHFWRLYPKLLCYITFWFQLLLMTTIVMGLDLKLYISLLSSSWGMAKFLQLGPCQLIPQKKTGIVMLLVTISNFLGLLWKIIIIPTVLLLYIGGNNSSLGPSNFFESFWLSCCVVLLPSILLVII